MLTLDDYLTSSGKYPWRAKHQEVTEELKKNARDLLDRVNALLKELHVKNPRVSSGFRPSEVNKKTPGASKKSGHMFGTSIDLADADGKIGADFFLNLKLLEKHGLYLESPKYTQGWVHVQTHAPKSGNRMFIPG